MLLNGDMLSTRRELVADLRSEVMRLEREVKVGKEHVFVCCKQKQGGFCLRECGLVVNEALPLALPISTKDLA